MLRILLVGAGGCIGAISRYGLSGLVFHFFPGSHVFTGTLVSNLLGCFLIGLLAGLGDSRGFFSPEIRLLIFTGFLGGFTTFSTFGLETFGWIREGQPITAFTYVIVSVIAGLLLVWLGWTMTRP